MNLYVTHVLWLGGHGNLPAFSGAENHLWMLLPALKERGVDVELLVLLWKSNLEIEARLRQLRDVGVSVTILQMESRRNWWLGGARFPRHIAKLAKELRKRRERIIHLHLDYFVQPVAALLAGCKLVGYSIHNDEEWFQRSWARLWLWLIDKWVIGYIAISNRTRQYFMEIASVASKKVQRVYYGVVPWVLDVSVREIRERLKIPLNRFVVGFVGRLTYQKNLPLLIQAMRRLPGFHCVIIGDGHEREKIRAEATGISNIQFLGFQPDAHKIMPAFDVFCLPSRYEGLGLVLIEAMLNRVPIVASRAGAIPEILQQGKFGCLFDSGDIEGLIAQLKYVQGHPDEMATVVEEARQYALETFTVEAMAEQTIDVYRQWLSRSERASRAA